jgi:calcineurin-like phosphoesterase family protein
LADLVIADTHFYHYNIIRYCDRPFKDVQQMNEIMITRWNHVVSDEDTVYHLGDFAFGRGSRVHVAELVEQLNGSIILIKGNHDRETNSWYKRAGFADAFYAEAFEYENDVFLSHHPWPVKSPRINIHGHIHNLMHTEEHGKYACVSVEQIHYQPQNLRNLITSIQLYHVPRFEFLTN